MDATPPTPRPASQRAIKPDPDQLLARNRIRFLSAEQVDSDQVREAILTSWWRSKQFDVPADRIELPYTSDQDLDSPLIRGAEPVLARLGEQLEGQPISLILTDATGVVVLQHTGDPDLHRHLESVNLVPGFSYGERFVGTNGIGTALEDGRPMHVFGHEHYAEHLENLACAGVPIHHPVSGKIIGAVDLTCWRKDAGRLLIALARTTAEQIRQGLLTHSNMHELALFQAYMQAGRHFTGIVIAFNSDIVMMNDCARQLLDPADQSVLLDHARRALADNPRITATVTLLTGTKVRMRCRRVRGSRDGDTAGGVVSVQLIEGEEDPPTLPGPMVPMFLPGIVGVAPVWQRCCQQVDAHYRDGDWLVLAGEPGTGKYSLARAVHQRHNPTGRLHGRDAIDQRAGDIVEHVHQDLLDDPVRTLVIRHLDQADSTTISAVAATLRKVRDRRRGGNVPWVVLTLGPEPETDPGLTELLATFPHTVPVPPLRRHIQDLDQLVPLLLARLGQGNPLTCSPAAMHLLMRASWPGNVPQLHRVLKDVTARRRAGAIQPSDLPAELHTAARRPLNRLETIERDAIVQSLEDARGNKAQAAKLLGMSRATIYRKIHEYGIVARAH